MPRIALTDRFCASAKPLGGRVDYFDTTVKGLSLRVTEGGHRSWSFLFSSPRDGKRARATLGTYPATPLASARARALEARGHVDAGEDPRLVLAGQGAAQMTIEGLVGAYLRDPEKAALRSRDEIQRRLNRNVVPMIGALKLSDLRRRDVRSVTDAILNRGAKVEATRVFEDIRAIVRWAVENEYLEVYPLNGMAKPSEATSSDRVLSDAEIHTMWCGLPDSLARSVSCQWIIKLCLVTAQRVGEVAGLLRAELDLGAREWRIPGSRTKNGHAHVVPLSDLAIEFIREVMKESGIGEPVFPSGESSLAPAAVARTILRANEVSEKRPLGRFGIAPWSAHDLRRTALTGMARLRVPPIVLGHIANHRTTTRAGVTLAVYDQYTYDKEKREALDCWAERLLGIVSGKVGSIETLRSAL
jgi:integrase